MDFSSLDQHFGNSSEKPSTIELVFYLFFDKGISLEEFSELPIPYIMNIVKTQSYIKEQERLSQEKK